jgi:hypothetical protein
MKNINLIFSNIFVRFWSSPITLFLIPKSNATILKRLFFFAFIGLSITFWDCSKKVEEPAPPPPAPTVLDLLTTKGWIRTEWYNVDPINGTSNVYPKQRDCEKDDVWFFQKDGSLPIREGATSCNPPQGWNERWTLSNDQKTITIVYGGSTTLTYTIFALDANSMHFKRVQFGATENYVFKH